MTKINTEQLDLFLKTNCRRDCAVISNGKISKEEESKLIELIGEKNFKYLKEIADEVKTEEKGDARIE